MVFERQIRTQILAIPQANVSTFRYDYGPFRAPNSLLPPEIDGIALSSPLSGYNPRQKQFRLCWSGYEDDTPSWEDPLICDSRLQITGSLRRGLIWIPQNGWEGIADNLVTLGDYNSEGDVVYKYITAATLEDNTIMLSFEVMGEGGEGLGFEFRDISTSRLPGAKTMSLSKFQAWAYWSIHSDDWERRSFYVCDHPDYGRSVFLADPYKRTNNKNLWNNIPCQVCDLRARYWYEDKRVRDVRPLVERQGNLQFRDYEDPENVPNYYYSVTHRNIPRRVTFVDEDGEVELPWTNEELAQRRASERQGIEYVRPYIMARRAGAFGRTESTMDASTIDVESMGNGQQQIDSDQREMHFQQLMRTIRTMDELDDTDERRMSRIPPENRDGDRRNARNPVDMDLQRETMQRALDSVLRTGNMIALRALVMSDGVFGLGDLTAEVVRELDSEGRGMGPMSRLTQLERPNGAQEGGNEDEDSLNEPLENINPNISPGDSATGSGSGSPLGSGADSTLPLQHITSGTRGGYCSKFLGRFCNTVTTGLSNMLGWSQGPALGNVDPREGNPREPVEFNIRGN